MKSKIKLYLQNLSFRKLENYRAVLHGIACKWTLRHLIVGLIMSVLVYSFWLGHYEWQQDMRLWKSFGDVGYIFLAFALIIGPLSKLKNGAKFLILWRREVGIWAAVLAIIHGVLIVDGWIKWDVAKFFGYEFIPQLGRLARLEPGFGLANLIGFVAFLWLAVLAITSSDRIMRFLGGQSWKWLHTGSYIVFYLTSIHTSYFLFMHYTESFHREIAPQSVFIIPFIVSASAVLVLQFSAYIKMINMRKKHLTNT
ncbi:ferric reductase-like transmembrane domain-containing protein [Candidatus Nitrosotenuis aquarius]|uniref:ferric reductase-like transmembrane domain-containing protein n=1 Tax=Candidatus Nitrosotenuis aquarius TaxID=1846278 RepID=UPI000C1DF602|nr:ferric reductase-like transmembrane domain-containing protein [Candidatus Nitrosotenuis aquarius]